VVLNFNGLSWPHITVATLRKQGGATPSVRQLDPDIPASLIPPAPPAAAG
jgi:hypothetical protein